MLSGRSGLSSALTARRAECLSWPESERSLASARARRRRNSHFSSLPNRTGNGVNCFFLADVAGISSSYFDGSSSTDYNVYDRCCLCQRDENVPESVPAAGQNQPKTTPRQPTRERKPLGKPATYRGA